MVGFLWVFQISKQRMNDCNAELTQVFWGRGGGRLTEMEASMCFLQSRMLVMHDTDEEDRVRMESLTFVDFLEAIARVVEMTSVVTGPTCVRPRHRHAQCAQVYK